MTQQWMTTLKGSLIPAPIKKNLEKAADDIRKILEKRGVQLTPADLAALLEQISPRSSKEFLSYALDLLRPFTAGLGFRIARLSDTQVEIVIPDRTRNLTENREIHEAVLSAAGIEAFRQLWLRHAPLGNMVLDVQETTFKKFHPVKGPCRAKMELSETTREKILAQLRSKRKSESDAQISVFDENDQKVAELTVKADLKWTPALKSSK
jgi:hypothetical protein